MKSKALLSAMLAGILGAAPPVLIKHIGLSPFVIAGMRTAFPLALLFLYFRISGKPIKHRLSFTTLLASVFTASHVLFLVLGYQRSAIGNAVVASYTWPIFALVTEYWLLKSKLTLKQGLVTVLGFGGVVATALGQEFSLSNDNLVGSLFMVLAAVSVALSLVLFKKEGDKHTPLQKVYYQNMAGAVVFLPFLLFASPFPDAGQLGLGLGYGLATLGIFGLAFYAIKTLSATTVSSAMYIEVVATIAAGVILLGENLTVNVVAGAVLITLSGILLHKFIDNKEVE